MLKCILSYLVVVLLPSTLFCLYAYNSLKAGLRYDFLAQQSVLVEDVARRMYSYFPLIESTANLFQNYNELIAFVETDYATEAYEIYEYRSGILPLFDNFYLRMSNIKAIDIFSDSERLIKNLAEFHTYADIRCPEETTRKVKAGKRVWDLDTSGDAPRIYYYFPLYNKHITRQIATIRLTVDFGILTSLFDPDGADTFLLVDSNGVLMSSAAVDDDLLAQIIDYCDAHSDQSRNIQTVFLDRDQYINDMWIEKLELHMVTLASWPLNVLAGTYANQFYLVLGMCIVVNLLFFAGILMPIQNIQKLSQHMGKGILTEYSQQKIPNDEIGDLIRAYNYLVVTVREAENKVRRSELLRMDAQLSAMKAQINPHFFYGTLECIRMLAEADGNGLIADTAYAFSNLMRHSLSKERYSTIAAEVEIAKQYASIQELRMGDKVRVDWSVDDGCGGVVCPHIILQPLVENIFVHSAAKTKRTVRVHVVIRAVNDGVGIDVFDDGPGISAPVLEEIQESLRHPEENVTVHSGGNGRAIININSRLHLYYGKRYTFAVASEPYRETRFSLCIPTEVTEHIFLDERGDE